MTFCIVFHKIFECFIVFVQVVGDAVFLLSASATGIYYKALTTAAHRRTFRGTRTCIESRVKLECEKEQQEQLLLSVIPAYIAAEVRELIRCIFFNLTCLAQILIVFSAN